jgi:hypothetical protein
MARVKLSKSCGALEQKDFALGLAISVTCMHNTGITTYLSPPGISVEETKRNRDAEKEW